MGLSKYQLGNIIIPYSEKCGIPDLNPYQVSGINRDKEFFEPSHQVAADTTNYQIVPPYHFTCNLMHVGRDKVLPIAYNHSEQLKYVSPAYSIFYLKENCGVIDEYLFMMLKSSERDRYFWFHSDASVRDGMSWNNFKDIEFYIPNIQIQQKYVDIYLSMLENQKCYERGLDDLKIVCDGYIEDLRRKIPSERIGPYLNLVELRNEDSIFRIDSVRGISIEKKFIETKADMSGVDLKPYFIIRPNGFAYVPVTSRNGEKITIAINNSDDTYICSSAYMVFESKNAKKLLPQYIMMYFMRSEFDRYARFHSWGSARETFTWDDLCDVKIPIPDIETQKAISEIYAVYNKRREINEKLKEQIKNICPILIKGSFEEGKNGGQY